MTALVLLSVFGAACANSNPAGPPPSPVAVVQATRPPPAAVVSDPTAAAESIPFVQIAVGRYGARCGLQEDGRAVCRGNDQLRAAGALPSEPLRQITVGQDYACGLRRDGTLACWGDALYDKTAPPSGQFTHVAAGKQHACALDTAGYAQCWGWNESGRAAPPTGISFAAIAAGSTHSCGLTGKGALLCWGKNDRGQAKAHSGPFQSLTLGRRHTCALRPDGAAWCQGDDSSGQSRPPPGTFTQIAAGGWHTCGLRPEGKLDCWGGGFGTELGEPAGTFAVVSGAWDTYCALDAPGYPRCWRYAPGSRQPAEDPTAIVFAEVSTTPLRQPVDLFPWPGGGLSVVEREGRILLCQRQTADQCVISAKPLLDRADATDDSTAESGMLNAALDPDFARFPFLYVYYTVRDDPRKARLSRFPVAAGRVDPAGELVILELPMPKVNHYGGALRFGPDGMLYLGIGENQFSEEAQSLASRRGKIIRIDGRGATPERPYQVPADNPFGTTAGAQPEIWAYGLRNPWRMSFDAAGRLWVGDVGESVAEEVSIVAPGANLGWPVFEGDRCRGAADQCAALPAATPPAITYGRDEGCAVIWGGQYQGAALPQLAGDYLFGDYCSGRIWALTANGERGWQRRLVATVGSPLLSFGTDAAGEMYVLSVNRPLLKLTPDFGAGP